jgi:hypothetical protein
MTRMLLLIPLLALPALAAMSLPGCMGNIDGPVAQDPTPPAVSPQEDDELRERLDEAIDLALRYRRLNLTDHAAWQIVHGSMAFHRAFLILKGDELVSAIDYVFAGGKMKGWDFEPGTLFDETTGRRGLRSLMDPGSKSGQGHPDQWLGYLAECGFSPDETIRVGDETFTIADLVEQAEWDVPRNMAQEFSWTLMALSAYRPPDYTWIASDGQTWSIERLVEIEAEHDLATSACGGCHRLFALASALNRHLAQGGTLEGGWLKANDKIQDSIRKAREYQNPDGSFSTNYFQRPGRSADLSENLRTTGHVLEFLTAALTQEELEQPWVRRGALKVCDILVKTKDVPMECGALYHAAHGLVLYRARIFEPLDLMAMVQEDLARSARKQVSTSLDEGGKSPTSAPGSGNSTPGSDE